VLGTRPDQRAAALRLFEETLPRAPLAPNEQLRLARLQADAGNHAQAGELMRGLLAEHGDSPQYLSAHVRLLLRAGRQAEARTWLARLEKREPDAPRTRALRAEADGKR
jgi:Tfp pilus assembly protein PilF